MQTSVNNNYINTPPRTSDTYTVDGIDKSLTLQAAYRQLFKANRDLEIFHNSAVDSAYLHGQFNTRELICKMICSDMYINYILSVNSNYRFVELCFERVLGRPATQKETFTWSSLLASEGLEAFADKLTSSEEYVAAFGNDSVPHRRSEKVSPSDQGLPALPKELSAKRYQGEGMVNQYTPMPYIVDGTPDWAKKAGAVLTVAGCIEIGRIIVTIALGAFGS